jgi:Mn2+/Fe2+ NRAMP family transporter
MEARDPYLLDPALVADPPQSWLGRLRELGPGLVLTASIVGSGELIATTTLGAKAGFTALWVILLSCLVKVALQLEFGRHTIQTGETCLTAFNHMPGAKFLNNHWTVWFWLAVQPLKVLQVGGIVGGVAIIMNMVCPALPTPAWCAIAAVATAAIMSLGRYRLIEQVCVTMVAGFTLATIVSVISLQWTPYAMVGADVLDGLRGALPTGAMAVVIAAFGLTGVGGDEILHYTYWLIEKGYAAKTGRRDATDPAWAERARGWIRLMYLDAFLSMAVYTAVTSAFYVLGAAVLHARGEAPKGYQMVETLARMYTETLGSWAHGVFLLGAFFVLYSTLFSALAAWTRISTDAAAQFRLLDFGNLASRRRAVVFFAWVFPLAWAAIFLVVGEPVWMVTVGGIATAAILLIVIVGAIRFRLATAPELQPGWLYDAGLWLSIASIGSFAAYSAWKTLADFSTNLPR